MTFAERCIAVEALGFTAPQAAFLSTVALHSGYCVGRQYAACSGLRSGRGVRGFIECLVDRRFADRIVIRSDRGIIYHLVGQRLYAALGQADSNNRRHASPRTIAQKLMVLDFVLAHPDFEWYPCQADRTDLFVTQRGAPPSAIVPSLRLPVFLHGASPCVNFVCLVTDPRASAIASFIRDHSVLLRHVNDWTLHVLVPERVATDQVCEAAYARILGSLSMSLTSASREDWEWFTKMRPLVVSGDLRALDVADLRRYRTLSSSLEQRPETRVVKPLVVHHLPHSYTQFGFFAGVT